MDYFQYLDNVLDYAPATRYAIHKALLSMPKVYYRQRNINLIRLPKEALEAAVSELPILFAPLGLEPETYYAFVLWAPSQCGIHSDTSDHEARINLPVLNTAGTKTAFYDSVKYETARNGQGLPVKLAINQNLEPCCVADSDRPLLLRVKEFHKVLMPLAPAPRITLSIGFKTDPVSLFDSPPVKG